MKVSKPSNTTLAATTNQANSVPEAALAPIFSKLGSAISIKPLIGAESIGQNTSINFDKSARSMPVSER